MNKVAQHILILSCEQIELDYNPMNGVRFRKDSQPDLRTKSGKAFVAWVKRTDADSLRSWADGGHFIPERFQLQ